MRRFLFGLASIIVLCALVVLSVELVVFDQKFYQSEYSKLNTAVSIGIHPDNLMDATTELLAYVRNEHNDLTMRYEINGWDRQLFNQKEIDHMVDVRNLYLVARSVRRVGMLVITGLLVYLFHKTASVRRKRIATVSKGLIDALIVMGIVVAFLAGFYLIDFDLFWTTFHKLVFTNDLWLLDPRTDILIQMVPTQFFIDCVGRIMLYTGLSLVSVLVLGILGQRVQARQRVA